MDGASGVPPGTLTPRTRELSGAFRADSGIVSYSLIRIRRVFGVLCRLGVLTDHTIAKRFSY